MRKIWNTMLKGLVAILPISLTLYLVYWLAVTAEQLFSRHDQAADPRGRLLARTRAAGGARRAVPDRAGRSTPTSCAARCASRRLFAPHPGGEDDLPHDPRLHAVLSVVGPGQRPKRVVMVPFGRARHRLRHGRVGCSLGIEERGRHGRGVPADELHGRRLHGVPAARAAEPTSLSVEAGMRIALMGGVQSARAPGITPRAEG